MLTLVQSIGFPNNIYCFVEKVTFWSFFQTLMNVIFRVLVLNCVSIRREVSNANVPPVDTSKTHMIPQDAGKYYF